MMPVQCTGCGRTYDEPLHSDENDKQDMKPGSSEPEQFMSTLHGYGFHYKPGVGEDPSKRRFGVMAQDVEQTPMGASFVDDTPNGKELDTTHGFGAVLASLGNLHRRTAALEEKRGKGKQ